MKRRAKRNYYLLITIIILSAVVLLSIGYSSFKNELAITNISSTVRIDKDIRVMGVKLNNSNKASSMYEDYNVANISFQGNLEEADSYLIYDVDVYNLGNVIMGIKSVDINNENLKVEILNYNLKDKICDDNNKCILGIEKKLQVKVAYKEGSYSSSNTSFNIRVDFIFGRIYNINYNDIDSTNLPSEIIEGDKLVVNIPPKTGYDLKVFMNGKRLTLDSDYQYENDTLTIFNVDGDIKMYYKMPICQRATVLHQEECFGNYCAGLGYKTDGSMQTKMISYGSLGETGKLSSGDAFDCDVDGDGVYDSATERFYYVTDMDNDTAVLIYYNNVSGGKPSNDKYYFYDSSGENWHGPRTAMEQLPTTSQWSNVKLTNTERVLTNEYGTNSTKGGYTYPDVLSYKGYAARLLTIAELRKIVGFYIPTWKTGEFDKHLYLVENTNFSKKDNSKFDGFWLESPRNTMPSYAWMIYATTRRLHSVEVNSKNAILGVRPVIEVAKDDINY